jgi:hippurate hydrolase
MHAAIALLVAVPYMVSANDELRGSIDAQYAELEKLYVYLHQHPELSFQEKETSKRIAKELRDVGYSVTEGVGGFGVVAVLQNGVGPTVLLRADMDGLPVQESSGVSYASKATAVDELGNTVSVMHACGHDIHMSVFIGTAQQLAARKDQWQGTLVMIAQPAEERGGGALAMLNDGLFERFPRPDYNLALHVAADIPAGKLGFVAGYALANVDSVDITVHGIGGHGAYPHTTKDPVLLASQIVVALQTLVSREVPPQQAAVVTVGSIHGGTKNNIISNRVDLQLTVRSYSDEVRQLLLTGIERIAIAEGRVAGLPDELLPTVVANEEYTPAVYNDPTLTHRIMGVLGKRLGADNIQRRAPVMGGEDFGRYGQVAPKIPSFMYWLGGVDPEKFDAASSAGKRLPSLHSPFFAPVPEPTIKTGVEAMTAAALELFD